MKVADIGIIGGSGLYDMPGLENKEEITLKTPFGDPSDSYMVGELHGKRVAFLARHNRKHNLMPSELNYRANIFAMKMLGVKYILSASAVGSMKEAYAPRHFVFPDQFIDRTRHRQDTFFGQGVVVHVAFGDPVCAYTQQLLYEAAKEVGVKAHCGGTYLCMEGPQFSTRAESMMYRGWGVDVIGMTNLQEARLSREAEIAYATMAMVTDYDCWHEEEEDVTVESVVQILRENADDAARTLSIAIAALDLSRENHIHSALQNAIITPLDGMSEDRLAQLRPIIGKYARKG